ncbi:MAG: XrtN system VIT domain-containing protein, partial [Bacteroidales bacterium]|nr:XrtN system VIT domain-containing protein [Bacteroidales bacterium]
PIGIVGLVFFGLTLYLFTPLILLVIIIYQFFKNRIQKSDNWLFLSGITLSIVLSIVFLIRWQATENQILTTYENINKNKSELPGWLVLGQQLPVNELSLKVLSSNLCCDNLQYFGNWSNMGSNTISENVTHDPLIIIAQLLFGNFSLNDETCLKIIEFQYDARHETYRKLWTGRDLETKQIISNIQVYPDYRLAYIEKTITVKNNSHSKWSEQEALYTFKMPGGAVATSLSLWINGKEEKSRLTTKEKADSAYTTIVGKERRDPALLHWQEGNTITVTIFPCTIAEDRIFKIGVTCPLEIIDNQLELNDITFKGPTFSWTNETSSIEFISSEEIEAELPYDFERAGTNKYIFNGTYAEDKPIRFKAPNLSTNSFSFNDRSYSLSEIEPTSISFNPTQIYLDINSSWTYEEFERVLKAYLGKQIYVYNNQLVLINNENKERLFNQLNGLNFSIFPIFKIENPGTSLLISKSTKNSPNLKDFNETDFSLKLETYLQQTKENIKLINIGTNLSPYLKSLKEFMVFDYWQSTVDELIELNKRKVFPVIAQEDNSVALAASNCKITMHQGESKSEAPDHLMRLFAYNQIMKLTGRNYFNNNAEFQEDLVSIANEAYVVSPISSLVVLETIKDYERFDIQKNENSLENAAKNSSGAVPEPHEWVLILLTLLVVWVLYYRRI